MSSPGEPSAPSAWAAAFAALRAAAGERAAALGTPVNALEDWRYVALAPLKAPLATTPRTVTMSEIDAHRARRIAATIVLVDGVFRADLSNLAAMPSGAAVDDLMRLPTADGEALTTRWRAQLLASADASVCWSFADCAGGIRLRARGIVAQPIHLLSLATGGSSAARVVIELAPGSALDLAISHIALDPSRSTPAIEVEIGAGASLRVDELQGGLAAERSLVFPLARLALGRDAQASWTSARAGAALGRSRVEADLDAAGCSLSLRSLAVLAGARQWHDVLRVRHHVGPSASSQLFKNIAGGTAIASFDGLVAIDQGADQASAVQRNHNLLLSPKARIDARPQLDILADDVKASHGATVGQLDADELFYLQARGIDQAAARTLLTSAFAGEVAELMHFDGMRELVKRIMLHQLG